uniref:C2H2-type domain-containing protein n=1 Tax=Glossina brevipalpis TaxID=37001 RepID=A0A1A9WU83_9MUSC
MNMNEEDFTNSDAWLSEQLFAQLKDFNTDYKERNNASVMIDDSFQNYSINSQNNTNGIEEEKQTENRKQHFEPFDTFFKKNKNNKNENQYDMNSDVSGLSNTSNRAPVVDSIIDFTTTLPLVSAPVVAEAAAVVSETVKQNISLNFDPNEEEMKLLKFLETQPKNTFLDPKMYMQSELPSTAYRIVKCANCNCLFDIISFQSHVCDYDEQQNLLVPAIATPSSSSSFSKPVKDETLLPSEPACIRLLRENQIRIRRFLKDELKYDVNAVGSNGSASSVHLSGSTSSSSSGFNASTNSTGSSNSSLNKKQDGPHDCTICERKFVHASGLLRHMEKHALDLIPGSNASGNSFANGNSLQSVNGLRLVIKCTLCGRIFFEPTAAFEHLCNHFPGSGIDEKEIDNSAEVPYETYVDDAMKLLKMECEFCDLVFSEVSYLFVHSACHLPERRFECFACDIHVKTSKEISTHWQAECVFMRENIKIHQAATQRYFVCNVCENKFQSLDQLHEHRYTSYHFFPRINKRLGVLQLPCEYCEALFENTQECVNHYEEKHYKKNKREKDASGTSHKTRQYLCDICGKSYTQSSHLWQHLRFHQGVKPFACKEPGCNRKFTIRPDLNDHIRKCHTGERPYQCLICGKRFLTGSVFYQHRLIHRGERRYECEECGKRFYRADALKNHQRIHTGEKPFGCLFCTKNFRQRGDRDKHIRARHAHLDANARLMMQMQKLQLEAAAAVAAAQVQVQQKTVTTANTLPMFNTIRNINDDENSLPIIYDSASLASDQNDVVMVGNVAFPKSMFEPIMPDIDEESAIKAMHQM